MAGEPNTAEKQNEIRREQKRKQRLGRGRRKDERALENVKIKRHVTGKFTEKTEEAIKLPRFRLRPSFFGG